MSQAGPEIAGPEHSGHEGAWRQWRSANAGERMHHAWLLAGKRGIGKFEFAQAAARELVSSEGTGQIADHPDIMILTHLPANADEEKKKADGKPWQPKRNIAIDQIREMQHRLTTRPTLGSKRAIIVYPADDLEKGAANALLKSLEEPPQGTYFLLVTHRPGRLLPTIRSRCQILRFAQAPDSEVDAILSDLAQPVDAETRAAAISVAGGSPGVAIEFVEQDLAPLHRLMRQILSQGDSGFELRGQLAGAMGQRPTRDRQLAAIDLARSVIAQQLQVAERSQLPGIIEAHGELNRLASQAPTYNFDAGLLVLEIGTLLASAAPPREPAHG